MSGRLVCVVTALTTVLFAAPPLPAQHHGHGPAVVDGHRSAQACSDEFDAVVRAGRGFGMAFAADQNGYPGPLHVLELKDRLGLDAAQETRVRALLGAMFDEARPKGARLLDAEDRLRRLFATGTPDANTVRAAVAEVELARTELRLVHLLAHLETRAVLTEAQRRLYHAARWPER